MRYGGGMWDENKPDENKPDENKSDESKPDENKPWTQSYQLLH